MTRRKTPRRLSADERELWRQVAETTKPMHMPPVPASAPAPVAVKPGPVADPKASTAIPAFRLGERALPRAAAPDFAKAPTTRQAGPPVAMDKHTFGRMRRGKLSPEARIDLHGLTLAEAHPALTGFILRSAGQGKRLVLVITGKGKGNAGDPLNPARRSVVLRHQVPVWLSTPPLAPLVLEISEAHVSHGGGGALYVYLRRARPGRHGFSGL